MSHRSWSSKDFPFLKCYCERGDAFVEGHICKLISDEDYKKYWLTSRDKYREREQNHDKDIETHYKDHIKWCARNNYGISHFGVSPDVMPLSSLLFDVFHQKCSICRSVISFTRDYVLSFSQGVIELFTTQVLKKIWGDYQCYLFNNNKDFNSLIGKELFWFVSQSHLVTDFLENKIGPSITRDNLIATWNVIPDIFEFLSYTVIPDEWNYSVLIEKFKKDVKDFYNYGVHTFMTDKEDGDLETAYQHILRFYMPQIAVETYNELKMGVGIYTMQGFERRNKESKYALKNHSNMKGNVTVSNLQYLFSSFQQSYDVSDE